MSITPDKRGIQIIFFLFLHENIGSRYTLQCLNKALLIRSHNIWFHGEIKKKYQYFLVGKSALSEGMIFLLCKDGDPVGCMHAR